MSRQSDVNRPPSVLLARATLALSVAALLLGAAALAVLATAPGEPVTRAGPATSPLLVLLTGQAGALLAAGATARGLARSRRDSGRTSDHVRGSATALRTLAQLTAGLGLAVAVAVPLVAGGGVRAVFGSVVAVAVVAQLVVGMVVLARRLTAAAP